jgi:hypothetical protein
VISEEAPVLRASQYWNLLSVDVQREDGTSSRVTGAVFGNEPHIVQVRVRLYSVFVRQFPYAHDKRVKIARCTFGHTCGACI